MKKSSSQLFVVYNEYIYSRYGREQIVCIVVSRKAEEDREDGLHWSAEGIACRVRLDRQTGRQAGGRRGEEGYRQSPATC